MVLLLSAFDMMTFVLALMVFMAALSWGERLCRVLLPVFVVWLLSSSSVFEM